MTPAEARAELLDHAEWKTLGNWITSELTGASRRAKRRHAEQQAAEKAAARAAADQLRAVADLPDAQLQWLLEHGWNPRHALAEQ